MPRNIPLREHRDFIIKMEYTALKKERKYTTEYIKEKLSKKFWLCERTIDAIIWGEYDKAKEKRENKQKDQLQLFA